MTDGWTARLPLRLPVNAIRGMFWLSGPDGGQRGSPEGRSPIHASPLHEGGDDYVSDDFFQASSGWMMLKRVNKRDRTRMSQSKSFCSLGSGASRVRHSARSEALRRRASLPLCSSPVSLARLASDTLRGLSPIVREPLEVGLNNAFSLTLSSKTQTQRTQVSTTKETFSCQTCSIG